MNIPSHVITNIKDDMIFNTTVLSEDNTIINYNYCINQNSVENIAKIYDDVRAYNKRKRRLINTEIKNQYNLLVPSDCYATLPLLKEHTKNGEKNVFQFFLSELR